jgi:hypothetical protein
MIKASQQRMKQINVINRKNILKDFYEQGMLNKFWYHQSHNILEALIHKLANYHLKSNDNTSHLPAPFGYHKPYLEGLVGEALGTHGDFFLDIGANIGMSSHHIIEVGAISSSDKSPHGFIVYLQPAAWPAVSY